MSFSTYFSDVLCDLNRRYASILFAPAIRSKGIDEVSAVFSKATHLADFCLDLQILMLPEVLRFSAVEGEVDVIQGRPANEMDGPAFHAAAQLMTDVETRKQQFRFCSLKKEAAADEVASRLVECCLDHVTAWSDSTARVACKYWFGSYERQIELAEELGITQQAVSSALSKAKTGWLCETLKAVSDWVEQAGR